MTQQTLFPEAVILPPIKLKLKHTRSKQMQAVLDKQSELFKAEFKDFAIKFAESHNDFLAEEIRFEYEKNKQLAQPTNWKASGGIIQSLVREKTFIKTGEFRYCKSGARQMAVYRLNRK